MIYPIMDANPNLLGCTLDLVNADTDALVSVLMHEIKEFCKGIPEAERIAPRRAKEGSFDLTSANAFMANPQWADNMVTIAKARMGNVETPAGPLVWVVLRTLLHQFAYIHRFWRQKEFFTDNDVAMYTNAVDRFREAWGDLGWKVSTWVHWTCAHSPYFAQAYRNIYIYIYIFKHSQ